MFRPLRRSKKQISEEAAKQLLLNEKRAVFAVNGDDGYPFAIPVNYFYDEKSNKIYLHGAKEGHKVDSLKKCDKVCFTVYGNERFKENDWAPYLQSVVVFGRCRLVSEADITEAMLRAIAQRYYPTESEINEDMAKYLSAVQVYEIAIEHMCGKEIHER